MGEWQANQVANLGIRWSGRTRILDLEYDSAVQWLAALDPSG
jgi:hypothetical protein